MEFDYKFKQENRARIIELISSLSDIDLSVVKTAVDDHGLEMVLKDPTIISKEDNEKLKDLMLIISFINKEAQQDE